MAFSFFNRDPHLGRNRYGDGATECEDDDKLQIAMTRYIWSPCVWIWGKRCHANFLYADWLGLDFDDGDPTLDQIKREICDYKRIIGVTENHQKIKHEGEKNEQPACDRFRVAIPFERRIETLDEFLGTMDDVKRKYPTVDDSALLGSQYFKICRELVVVDYKDPDLYSWPVSPPRRKLEFAPVRKAELGAIPYHTPAINRLFKFDGKHRHETMLFAAHDLARQGFDQDAIKHYIWNCIPSVHHAKNPADNFTDKEKSEIIRDAVAYINGLAAK